MKLIIKTLFISIFIIQGLTASAKEFSSISPNTANKSDHNRKSSITFGLGVSSPLGELKSLATRENNIDGAGTGSFFSLDYGYRFTNKITALAGINSMSLTANPKTISAGTNSIVMSGWNIKALLIGVKYSYPLKKINIEPSFKIGTSSNNSGNMEITQGNGYIQFSDLPSSNSFAYQLGLDIVYPITERWDLDLNSSFFKSKFEYNNYNKAISILNIGLGAKFKF